MTELNKMVEHFSPSEFRTTKAQNKIKILALKEKTRIFIFFIVFFLFYFLINCLSNVDDNRWKGKEVSQGNLARSESKVF